MPEQIVERLVQNGSLKAPSDLDLFIVVTHDCDLNSRSFQNEPHFEVLLARHLGSAEADGQSSWGKNPRRYQFKQEDRLYEISIHERFIADRSYLLACGPDNDRKVDHATTKQICLWVSKRYFRSAFPDAFNDRLRPVGKDLRKILSEHGANLSGIYLNAQDAELAQEEPYAIIVRATMRVQDYEKSVLRSQAQRGFDNFVSHLGKCEGISIVDGELVSEADISIDDLRLLKRWDYDDLSLRNEDWETIAPLNP